MSKQFAIALAVVCCIPPFVILGVEVYREWRFYIDCTGHLKRAADANTTELAKQELGSALKFLESKNMTSGHTAVLFQTPDTDVSFWYQNLKASLNELQQLPTNAQQLEKSNVLLKLRETLLDHGQGGDVITKPTDIALFPDNKHFFFAYAISIIVGIVSVIVAVRTPSYRY
jgi:hypothetical protein